MISLYVAGGILLAYAVFKTGALLVNALDHWSSQITDEEAHRRAQLSLAGKWPPSDAVSPWKPVAWTWAIIALLWMGWGYLRGTWR